MLDWISLSNFWGLHEVDVLCVLLYKEMSFIICVLIVSKPINTSKYRLKIQNIE